MVQNLATPLEEACPLWVISRHLQRKTACPLCPQKRTCAVQLGMSAKCQKRTLVRSNGMSALGNSRLSCPALVHYHPSVAAMRVANT